MRLLFLIWFLFYTSGKENTQKDTKIFRATVCQWCPDSSVPHPWILLPPVAGQPPQFSRFTLLSPHPGPTVPISPANQHLLLLLPASSVFAASATRARPTGLTRPLKP